MQEISKNELGIMLLWAGLAVAVFAYCRVYRVRTIYPDLHDKKYGLKLFLIAWGIFFAWIGLQIALGVIAVAMSGSLEAFEFSPRAITVISFVASILGIAGQLIWLLADRRETRMLIHFVPVRPRQVVRWGVSGAIVAMPLTWIAMVVAEYFMQQMNIKHPDEHALLKAMEAEPSWIIQMMGILAAAVLAPVFEEILFRGFLQTSIKHLTGQAWIGIAITSLLFAIIHEYWTWLPIFVLSILFGLIFEYSRSIWASILTHALFNSYNVLIWLAMK